MHKAHPGGRLARGQGTTLSTMLRRTRRVAAPVTVALVLSVAGQLPASAEVQQQPYDPPKAPAVKGVDVAPIAAKRRPAFRAAQLAKPASSSTWPAVGTALVDLPATAGDAVREPATVKAGALPVSIGREPGTGARTMASPSDIGTVRVQVLDRAASDRAGVAGPLIRINRADGARGGGTVNLTVDYRSFAQAYGGDWASRLRVVAVPGGHPLRARNNMDAGNLTATVPLAADGAVSTVALSAGAAGPNGDYTATSLSASSTWQVSQQTGTFSWSYPLRMPPAVGGPEPSLKLAYSSGAIDGRTAGTNNQGSWIGDGWDMWPGYVERQYRSCSDDKDAVGGADPNNKTVDSADQCWATPDGNATLSLNGRATELVKSAGNTWRGVADDGSKIEQLKNTALDNGDDDGEYWKVTTIDGTQHFYGRNVGPGGASGTTATNSTWTTEVYGNHPEEAGYVAGSFATSRRTQAWRWNLDYVVDPYGNTMTYFYGKETGAYGREGDVNKRTSYTRGGWLSKIEYGNRADASAATRASARVLFDVVDRCSVNCYDSADKPVRANWLDTPWDQYCAAAPCTDQLSPTFWTGKRLASIRTQIYAGSGDTYRDVEGWTLRHTYLQAGGDDGRPMWLAGVTRTGKAVSPGNPEVSDPEVTFDAGADARPNRVDAPNDGRSSLFRHRINLIKTESGGTITVTYSAPQCVRSALPSPHNNTKRCFPQFYAPEGEEPTLDWFHKYVVTRVDVGDQTGGFVQEQTNYDYLDTPAWHYDDSELVKPKKRTWGQFRGYGHVRVRTGLETGVQSATEYVYFRGMDEDRQPSGTPARDVWVVDSQGGRVEDHDAYAGMVRETTGLNGVGGPWVSGTISAPVRRGPTATAGSLQAWLTNTGTVRTRTRLASGNTRWTATATTFNEDNLPIQEDDLGDESTAADDTCTRTSYARNETNWMLDRVKKVESVGVRCATPAVFPRDLLAASRNTYDAEGKNWDTYAPVFGHVAKVEEVDSWNGSTPVWVTTGRTTHDANGRTRDAYDALNRRTSTTYTPASGGPVSQTLTTNALGHQTTTTLAPAWGQPTRVVDANASTTDLAYDALGRIRKVWLPGNPMATRPNDPSIEHSYLVRNNAPTAITTRTATHINSQVKEYRTSIALLDGLLRARQTQEQAPGGGRVITDVIHDSRGLVEWTSNRYYDLSGTEPNTGLVGPVGQVDHTVGTRNVHDGAGRLTTAILMTGNEERWRTTTGYVGERTNVTPPDGGTATTAIMDGRGRTTELRQYRSPADVGSDDATTFHRTAYGFTDRGELASMTDAAGNTWRYEYDQRGRTTREEDPDRGVTTSTYHLDGQLRTTTNARGVTLATTYDAAGRKRELREGSTTGALRSEWRYDTATRGKGRLHQAIRYEPAGSANAYVNEVASYTEAGQPDRSRVTLPAAAQSGLCVAGTITPCTYEYTATFRVDGQPQTLGLPAAANVPSELMKLHYDQLGNGTAFHSAQAFYVNSVSYTKLGHVGARSYGEQGKRVGLSYRVDEVTGRLAAFTATPELKPPVIDAAYEYDNAGNLLRIHDAPAGDVTDTQCFRYDHLRRLSEAWTPAAHGCQPNPAVAQLGGAAKYWHSYTYDASGNRKTELQHGTTDVTREYRYPPAGGAAGSKPHAVTEVLTTGAVTKTQSYAYNETGETVCRPATGAANACTAAAGRQTLTWGSEDQLATTADATGTTSFIYDADGNRLIRKDPTGSTLYLPQGTEVRKPISGSATATRHYGYGGVPVAVRTAAGLSWIVADHHGTAEVNVNSTDLAVTRQRTLPFGESRGVVPTVWAGDKGFVGGTKDNTGLTHLGAREYDPGIGRFISVDPLLDLADPQQWNGYVYANNNPATLSDPSGLIPADCMDFDCYGYDPNKGCPHGCGSDSNKAWGEKNNKPSTRANRRNDPRQVGHQIRVPRKVDAEKFTRIWNNLRGQHFGSFFISTDQELFHQEFALAMTVCGKMGRNACGDWFYELFEGFWKTNKALPPYEGGGLPLNPGALAGAGRAGVSGKSGGSCGGNSFVAGTKVLMADGGTKAIEDVRPGDTVVATDPETGRAGPRVVTHKIVGSGTKELVELRIDTDGAAGDAVRSVTATAGHPFWLENQNAWVPAELIKTGDALRGSPGNHPRVVKTDSSVAVRLVYNLTVSDIHTYYVMAGNTPVLVHNTGCGSRAASELGDLKPIHGIDPNKAASLRQLSDEDLLRSFNNPADGGAVLVTRDGTIMNGHHRIAELQRRMNDPNSTITPGVRVRIDEYQRQMPSDGFWD